MSNPTPRSERIIDVVNRLSEDGTLDRLLKAGLIDMKVILRREMYLQYDLAIRVKRMKIREAQLTVACQFNCNPKTVRRAVLSMEKE